MVHIMNNINYKTTPKQDIHIVCKTQVLKYLFNIHAYNYHYYYYLHNACSERNIGRTYCKTYMASYIGNQTLAVVCCGSPDGRQTLPALDDTRKVNTQPLMAQLLAVHIQDFRWACGKESKRESE